MYNQEKILFIPKKILGKNSIFFSCAEAYVALYKIASNNSLLLNFVCKILEDCHDDPSFWYRHISKGVWPFSTADNGYPVSDCTAEGLKNKTVVLDLMECKNHIPGWRCVECTSASIQALKSFKQLYPTHRRDEIEKCIRKGATFIEKIQRPDGSWYGTWGICFTHGTWFGVAGLVAAGRTYNSSPCIRKACNFLLSKQLSSGGWGESFLFYQDKTYTNLNDGHSHAVNTAWAMLALLEAGQAKTNSEPLHLAAKTLINMQMESREFPQQEITGASAGSTSMGCAAYRNIFPIWALGEYHNRVLLSADY